MATKREIIIADLLDYEGFVYTDLDKWEIDSVEGIIRVNKHDKNRFYITIDHRYNKQEVLEELRTLAEKKHNTPSFFSRLFPQKG
jgi:hypothetical protein